MALLPGAYSELDTLGGTALVGNGNLRLAVVGRGDKLVSPIFLRSLSRLDTGSLTDFDTLLGYSAPTTYYYVVTAVNQSGETIESNELNISVVTANDRVTVVWDPVTGVGITSYRIWRSATSGIGGYPAAYDDGLIGTVEGELEGSFVDTGTTPVVAAFPVANTALRLAYNTFRTFTSMTTMRGIVGSETALGRVAQISSTMGLNVMSVVSVDYTAVDAAVGAPAILIAKQAAYQAAVDELLKFEEPDIIVLMDPSPEIGLIGKTHVNTASSLLNRKERSLFHAAGLTDTIGDTVTTGTQVYNAVNSFNDRLMSSWSPVAPYAIFLDDLSRAAEIALDGSFTAVAAAILNVLQPDEATPITNKSFSAFTRFGTEFNRADIQILDTAGVAVLQTDSNGQSTVVHGITTATDTVENSEQNVVLQENTLLKELRSVVNFAIGQKNSDQVRLAVHDKVAQLLQFRMSAGLITEFSGLEVIQDPARPTYVLVSFSHVPMFGVNVVLISFSFDTRGAVGAT